MKKTYVTSMNKATANKVGDWLMVEQPKIWTVNKMHPDVEEELAQNAVEMFPQNRCCGRCAGQEELRDTGKRRPPCLNASLLPLTPPHAADEPLTSEMAEQTCAYYLSQVVRVYEVTDRDSDGDARTSRRSEVVVLMSYRSEEQLEKRYKRNALWQGLIAVGLFLFGLIFLAVGVGSAVNGA
jgi:hypothetical protein